MSKWQNRVKKSFKPTFKGSKEINCSAFISESAIKSETDEKSHIP